MALSCHARHAMMLEDMNTLQDDIKSAMTFTHEQGLPLFVLSFGSNVILPKTLNAVVLLPKIKGIEVIAEDEGSVTLQVACGENWHEFIQYCLDKGYYGLENLALIPGLVGACPVQNIGAYGVQVSDFISKVIAFDLMTGEQVVFDNAACEFDYRHSFFKEHPNRYLISQVVFCLHKDDSRVLTSYGDVAHVAEAFAKSHGRMKVHPRDVFCAVVSIRQSKLPDPSELANCGSFFQNPIIAMSDFLALKERFADLPSYPVNEDVIKVPAGWLIDRAGLKGAGVAPILTHQQQALVLTNHAPHVATQEDIKTAQDFIIRQIQATFGITLVREPVWVD